MPMFKVGDEVEYINKIRTFRGGHKSVVILSIDCHYYHLSNNKGLSIDSADGTGDFSIQKVNSPRRFLYPYPTGYAKWYRQQEGT